MKNVTLCLWLFVVICSNSALSQIDSANRFNSSDSGFIVANNFHFSDLFLETKQMITGIIDGKYIEISTDSSEVILFNIINSRLDGDVIYFHDDEVLYTGCYAKGGKNGLWNFYCDGCFCGTEYWDQNILKESILYYQNSVSDSVRKIFIFFKKEIYEYYTEYYKNGNKKMEGIITKFRNQNQWNSWYPNGKLKKKEVFINGKRNGLSYEYDTLGINIKTIKYRNEKPIRQWQIYSETTDSVTTVTTIIKGRKEKTIKTIIEKYYEGNITTQVIKNGICRREKTVSIKRSSNM